MTIEQVECELAAALQPHTYDPAQAAELQRELVALREAVAKARRERKAAWLVAYSRCWRWRR